MPKTAGQKLKLLYLVDIFETLTDEAHPLTVQQLIAELSRRGVAAERKSIYDDIEALQQYGMDIVVVRGRSNAYYLGERRFELPELKLLVDAASAAKFITEGKSRTLVQKVAGLASRHEAALLQRQVYVQGRVKSMNESVYYTMDALQTAIVEDTMVQCRYYEWAVQPGKPQNLERRWRHDGRAYVLSPWALLWDNENYYLLAFDSASCMLRHYRVDKLAGIHPLPQKREGRTEYEKLDMAAYTGRHFGMYGGKEQPIKLRFANHLAGVVVDRFGREATLIPDGAQHFTVFVRAVVSPQFYGWLLGFGGEAQLLEPQNAVQELRKTLAEVGRLYGQDPTG